MTATFVVEDGTGLSTANAYVSEAAADLYHENFGNPSTWTALSSDDKQEHIRTATRYLDAKYSSRWKGYQANDDQALDWPRSYVADEESDELPQALVDAACVAALKSVDDTLLPDVSNPGEIKRTKVAAGPLISEKEYVAGRSSLKRYTLIDGLLRGLLASPNRIVRG